MQVNVGYVLAYENDNGDSQQECSLGKYYWLNVMESKPVTFTQEDVDAIRQILPPHDNETWTSYLNRAKRMGLVTMKEIVYLCVTYGEWAMGKPVQPYLKGLTE